MTLDRIKWAFARLTFILVFSFCLLTGVGIYVAAPAVTYWYFGTFRFWRFTGYFPSMMSFAYRQVFMLIRDRNYRKYLSIPLTARPATGPDPARVRISDGWEWGEGTCGNCGRCCRELGCPLYERAGNGCLAYNSPYWRYFNCGRYPFNQAQIDYYQCPKWAIVPREDPDPQGSKRRPDLVIKRDPVHQNTVSKDQNPITPAQLPIRK